MLQWLCLHHLECYQHTETDSRNVVQNVILHSLKGFCSIHKRFNLFYHCSNCNNYCDPSQCCRYCALYLLAMLCCQCHSYIWTDQRRFLQMLVCQFWEVCQATYSMDAFSQRDKTEMTRQLPFCQHCHGSTGMAVYPEVNGMTPGAESARLRETCACFT